MEIKKEQNNNDTVGFVCGVFLFAIFATVTLVPAYHYSNKSDREISDYDYKYLTQSNISASVLKEVMKDGKITEMEFDSIEKKIKENERKIKEQEEELKKNIEKENKDKYKKILQELIKWEKHFLLYY